jgi:hypothetical protein
LLLLVLFGCSSSPPSSDAAKGKEILQTSLDSWKRGDSVQSLETGSPAIVFVDRQREKHQLLDFEIDPSGQPSGFDVQFKVQLSLKSPDGKSLKQKAKYNVSTTSKFVVVRSDES